MALLASALMLLAGCGSGSGGKSDGAGNDGGVVNSIAPQLAAGDSHTCFLWDTGNLRCWGYGGDGRLGHDAADNIGDGVGDSIAAAGDVPVGATVTSISANGATCALLDGGGVRCWGDGADGKLGYDATANVGDAGGDSIAAAGDVPVGGTVTQIASGTFHTCALLDTGDVRCWGQGSQGQLGYNATANVGDGVGLSIMAAGDVPVGGTVTQIAAGGVHTCALLDTGAVRCWGQGANGRLGYDATAIVGNGVGLSIMAAGDVVVGGTVTQITAGSAHTCALLDTGTVRCWGTGGFGQLGHDATDTIGDGAGPTIAAAGDVPVGGTVTRIEAGNSYTCAQLDTGAVRCWGLGTLGRLGRDSTNNIGDGMGLSIVAAGDLPVGGAVMQFSTGALHACVLLDTDAVRCWGYGALGQLGHDATDNIGDGLGPSIVNAGDLPLL